MPNINKDKLHELTQLIFRTAGATDDHASQVADVLIANNLAGHDSHGILRIPEYLENIKNGEIVPSATPEILQETPVSALISGNWSFGQVVGNMATDVAIAKAKSQGVAAVSVVQAAHTGRLAAFTERASDQGVVMFMTIGTVDRPMTAPYGGAAPILGTNPMAFSLPNRDGPAVTLDFATSAIAAGKIKVAKAMHQSLPPDTLMDKNGNPSTNPQDFFEGGFMVPFGGHKGYALAIIAEMMSGPLAGCDAFPGVTARSGIFIFALRADLFRPMTAYQDALSKSIGKIKAIPPAKGFSQVMMPGEPEYQTKLSREKNGIEIQVDTWESVRKAALTIGINIDN